MEYNDVPTTCTASLITGWDDYPVWHHKEEERIKAKLKVIDILCRGEGDQPYMADYAILHAFVTQEMIDNSAADEFLTELGFTRVFEGIKKNDDRQRHKESGTLFLYAVTPYDLEKSCEALKKKLIARLIELSPKKPDPARQKFPDMKLHHLKSMGIVAKDAIVNDKASGVVIVTEKQFKFRVRAEFGIDIDIWFKGNNGYTIRQLKEAQQSWKNELL